MLPLRLVRTGERPAPRGAETRLEPMHRGNVSNPGIVVAVDFSLESVAALREARRIARRMRTCLEVLHVDRTNGSMPWDADAANLAWLRVMGLRPPDVVVRRGFPWVEIVRFARERGCRMIVAGSHGASGYQPLTLGSTAAKLAVQAPCPVLLVNARSETPKPRHIDRRGEQEGVGTSSEVGAPWSSRGSRTRLREQTEDRAGQEVPAATTRKESEK